MQRRTLLVLTTALLSSGLSFVAPPTTANALPTTANARPVACAQLPAKLLGGNIKYANAQIVPANTAPGPQFNNFTGRPPSTATVPVTYCLVVLSYSSTPKNDPTPQNITVYVGLPLNSMDGGVTGSTVNPPNNFTTVEGNWNGRTEGQGGGGCSGNTNVNSAGAVTNGFVGSGTDGGHGGPTNDPGNTCQQGVLKLGQLNFQYIADWVYNGPQQEFSGRRRLPTCITARRRNTIIGTAVRPAVIRAMPWLKRWPTNWMASWPTRRRCTGRVSRQRRCGARLRCTTSPKG